MSFLAPLFLWLLPAISIPVIIHFLNRRNIIIIDFSSIRFLKKMEHESIKKLKILQILLLIIRTLIILCIVMMIVRPVARGVFDWVDDPASTFTAVVIDDTFSNFGEMDLQSRQEIVQQVFSNVLDNINDDAQISVYSLTKGEIFRGLKSDIPENLNTNIIGYSTGSFFRILDEIQKKIDREFANKEIFIISDAQSVNFQKPIISAQSDAQNIGQNISEDWNIYFYKLPAIEANLSILNVKIVNEIPVTNVPLDIEVTVLNNGNVKVENALLQLAINDINVGQQVINLRADEKGKFIFTTAVHETGKLQGVVELQKDHCLEDNRYYFYIDLPTKMKIALVTNRFEELLFTRNAITALDKDSILFDVELLTTPALTNLDFRNLDVLVFQGVKQIPASVHAKITKFLEQGGHFILFPGKDDEVITTLDFLDLKFEKYRRITLSENAFQFIDENAMENNIWQSVFNLTESGSIKYFKYIPQGMKNDFAVYLKNQDVIWNRLDIHNGLIDIFGFAIDLSWTNFPIKGSFIPFWHLLLYAGAQQDQTAELSAGEKWSRQFTPIELKQKISFVVPDGSIYLLNPSANQKLRIGNIEQIGFHKLKSGNNIIDEIAVNIDNSELEAPILLNTELKNQIGVDLIIIEDPDVIGQTIKTARLGIELWRWFLLSLLILIILEMYLSNVFGAQKR